MMRLRYIGFAIMKMKIAREIEERERERVMHVSQLLHYTAGSLHFSPLDFPPRGVATFDLDSITLGSLQRRVPKKELLLRMKSVLSALPLGSFACFTACLRIIFDSYLQKLFTTCSLSSVVFVF